MSRRFPSYGSLAAWSLRATAAVTVLVYLALVPVPRSDGHWVGSDGAYYYTYLRSWILDHDFNLQNDVDAYNARVPPGSPARIQPAYVFSIGPAILWAPVFVLAHSVAQVAAHAGMAVGLDGYSCVEEASVGLASLLYALAGLALLQRTVIRCLGDTPGVRLAPVAVFWGTSIVYYAVFEPSMSHAPEFFTIALFLWALLRVPAHTRARAWLGIGACLGLAVLVRWQNVVFGIPALVAAWRIGGRAATQNGRSAAAARLRQCGALVAGGILVASPQAVVWHATLGHFLAVPQGAGFLNFGAPQVLAVLFSARHGWFVWTPLALVGLWGLGSFRERWLAVALGLAVACDVYVCAIAQDWWGGDAFGMRRLVGALPVVALGLAALTRRMGSGSSRASSHVPGRRRAAPAVLAVFVGVLVAWNLAFLVQYRLGLLPRDQSPTLQQLVADKLLLPWKIAQKL